jgi:RNA polymerase sigma-B factor
MLATSALGQLSQEDRRVIVLRFRDGLSQSEIATRLGCSQMQVSRKLRKILDDLNHRLAPH